MSAVLSVSQASLLALLLSLPLAPLVAEGDELRLYPTIHRVTVTERGGQGFSSLRRDARNLNGRNQEEHFQLPWEFGSKPHNLCWPESAGFSPCNGSLAATLVQTPAQPLGAARSVCPLVDPEGTTQSRAVSPAPAQTQKMFF